MYNNTANAFATYQENGVLTASKGKLLIMLYEGAVKFLRYAKISIDDKNIEKAGNYIVKAEDIITELRATLNMDYEVSKSLDSLYEYMNYRLVQANIKKDKEIIDEISGLLMELKETWEKIV